MKKLPKVLYVKWNGDDEPFLCAEETLAELTEAEPVRVGKYVLQDEMDLRAVEEVKLAGATQWLRI